MKNSTSKSNVITQVLLTVVAGALGYLLLFDKNVQIVTLCQILCGGLVAAGVIAIVSYFLSGDYKRIDRYGFAIGVTLILLGCIGLLRMSSLTANFEIYITLLSLILGILTLQGTVQIKVLNYPVWILTLILSIACLGGAFCILSNIAVIVQMVAGFSNWVLLISGCSCLLSLIITWICILLAGRREKKAQQELENAPADAYEPFPPSEYPQPEPFAPQMSSPSMGAPEFEPAETHHSGFDSDFASSPGDQAATQPEIPEMSFHVPDDPSAQKPPTEE